MNNKNWKLDKDWTLVSSVSEVLIPWLGVSLEVWFDLEKNQIWWTKRQGRTFENLLALSDVSKGEFIEELGSIYSKELQKGKIEAANFENIFESIDWTKSHLCIPQLYDSECEYALLLLETKWKLVDSDSTLELEFLYTNGKIEQAQEMSGLWSRIEWFEDYLKRKTTYNK